MSGSKNLVILIGHVGRDPECRTTTYGTKIFNFSVATSESWKDKDSQEWKEKTEWHNVVVFNERFHGLLEKHVRKGSQVAVEGKMRTRKWQDSGGQDKYSTEVVLEKFNGDLQFLEKINKDGGGRRAPDSADDYGSTSTRSAQPAQQPAPVQQTTRAPSSLDDDLDDSIPF